ncbi:MAG: sensor domain-containing diguanylate cyclase [Acidobacteriia bacterium]|nr:sensor domain-containing diguanylate cyclase [Terriglobia bacterium]
MRGAGSKTGSRRRKSSERRTVASATGPRLLEDPWALAEFVRNVQEGIYVTTTDGRILDANPAFLRMFGVSSLAELGECKAEELLVEPQRRLDELAVLATDGSVREFELEIRRPDGEVRTVLDTAYQVADPETGETLFHGILIDITDRKELERQLFQAALRDPLTGCYNRRFLMDREEELSRGRRTWGVVIADIDHFKDYNDLHGHDTGDRVLVRVARFLTGEARPDDAVVRIGGDEFLILLTGSASRSAETVAKRLHTIGREKVPVGLSYGWAVREGRESLEDTIRRADKGLLRKRALERRSSVRRRSEAAGRRTGSPRKINRPL